MKESVPKDSGDEQTNAQWSLFEGLGERTKLFHVHHRFRDIFLFLGQESDARYSNGNFGKDIDEIQGKNKKTT